MVCWLCRIHFPKSMPQSDGCLCEWILIIPFPKCLHMTISVHSMLVNKQKGLFFLFFYSYIKTSEKPTKIEFFNTERVVFRISLDNFLHFIIIKLSDWAFQLYNLKSQFIRPQTGQSHSKFHEYANKGKRFPLICQMHYTQVHWSEHFCNKWVHIWASLETKHDTLLQF